MAIGRDRMKRWEAIFRLYTFEPHYIGSLSRYICSVCHKTYKTDSYIYRHVKNNHNKEINEIRDKAIIEQIL